MKIIDTHCHIFKEYYDDIPLLMEKINKNNIGIIVNNAVNLSTSKEIINTAKQFNNMYVTVGIHPEDVNVYKKEDLLEIENLLNNSKIIAIGEIGLDYHMENCNKEKQLLLFEEQLIMAEKHNLPVIIHSRDAGMDTLNLLKKHHVCGIIHCFSGSLEMAKEYIKLGFYLGINGVVTFKNAHLIDIVKDLGLEHFVLETDSPYLTPMPFRGEKNDPSYLNIIVKYLADNLHLSVDDVVSSTCKSVYHVFDKLK